MTRLQNGCQGGYQCTAHASCLNYYYSSSAPFAPCYYNIMLQTLSALHWDMLMKILHAGCACIPPVHCLTARKVLAADAIAKVYVPWLQHQLHACASSIIVCSSHTYRSCTWCGYNFPQLHMCREKYSWYRLLYTFDGAAAFVWIEWNNQISILNPII